MVFIGACFEEKFLFFRNVRPDSFFRKAVSSCCVGNILKRARVGTGRPVRRGLQVRGDNRHGQNGMDLRELHVGKLRGLDNGWLGEEEDHEREKGAWLTPRFPPGQVLEQQVGWLSLRTELQCPPMPGRGARPGSVGVVFSQALSHSISIVWPLLTILKCSALGSDLVCISELEGWFELR